VTGRGFEHTLLPPFRELQDFQRILGFITFILIRCGRLQRLKFLNQILGTLELSHHCLALAENLDDAS
ncbi:MAG: hypothetical protein ABL994_25270, partial [Verrucomicrobiales bacterium]